MSRITQFDYRTAEPLLWLGGAAREVRRDRSYFFDARQRKDRPHCCLQLTLAGAGFCQDDKGRVVLPKGWAFFRPIPGDFSYGYWPAGDQPYELVYVSLLGEPAMALQQQITQTFGPVLNLSGASTVAPQMLALARAFATGSLPDRYLLSAQLYQLLMTLHSTLTQTRLSTTPRLTRAVQLIAAHAADAGFGVNQLAGLLDCSREHLARVFQVGLGVSPSDYLVQHRLRLAAAALRSSDDKLQRIARRCGFSSANYLVRTFRLRVGTTPARYRKQPWIVGP